MEKSTLGVILPVKGIAKIYDLKVLSQFKADENVKIKHIVVNKEGLEELKANHEEFFKNICEKIDVRIKEEQEEKMIVFYEPNDLNNK